MAVPRQFVKMAGGGNDFLVFEADGRALSEADRTVVSRLCRRGVSVGADGALFLSGGAEGRIHLDYFNADGGLAAFCANGTRCAARYAVTRRLVSGREPVLETGWATIAALVEQETVSLALPPLPRPGDPLPLSAAGAPAGFPRRPAALGIPMHVGVPHLVVLLDDGEDLEALDVARLGPPLRRHPAMPDGANVNFVRVAGPSRIAVRTFERGVEGETLACGSGVVAAAIVASRAGRVRAPVVCETRSGAAFTVLFSETEDGIADAVLTGDAREIFTAEMTEEAWQE
ncbi:MAG: diaminopimelate epimerase [Acidobacteriota bacterium]